MSFQSFTFLRGPHKTDYTSEKKKKKKNPGGDKIRRATIIIISEILVYKQADGPDKYLVETETHQLRWIGAAAQQ